jgi:lysyl-tRNA synthetase class 2
MNYPDLEILRFRHDFLAAVRQFFRGTGYIEVETPALNPTGAVEAFLDPFLVHRTGPGKEGAAGYLITSPEYNLKRLAATTQAKIFEIAHCFRAGDAGGLHSEEFLMLEWYCPGATLEELILETSALLHHLAAKFPAQGLDTTHQVVEVEDLFLRHTGRGFDRQSLEQTAGEKGLGRPQDRYDELFFSIFLNCIEPKIRTPCPLFLKNYPAELAALSRTEGQKAKRFELYWQGIELCNAYEELSGQAANAERFMETNELRKQTGRTAMAADPEFLALSELLGQMCGNALGLDRLMMVYSGADSLAAISPFPGRLRQDRPPNS